MEERSYYTVRFIINGRNFYTLWYTDNTDGFVCESGKILYSDAPADIIKYAENNGLCIVNEPSCFNADSLDICGEINCSDTLDMWNILSDLAQSTGKAFPGDDRENTDLYSRLFRGCDLPAMEQEIYTPDWTPEEAERIKNIMKSGAMLLREAFEIR